MATLQKIAPCLWFDTEGEDAANFYVGIFKNSKIHEIVRYGEAGKEIHGREAGSVMTVAFELDGQQFTALNGGPYFKFNEAVSFQIFTEDQAETDYYWERLGEGGDPQAQQCGWLKDKFGLSWQVVPKEILALVSDPASTKSQAATTALLQMKRLDIAAIKRAYDEA